ncbi:hypothetical protein [Pseudomonas sp. CFBP 13719]|uniref:hypothetical protein n=1 Tax=Pseudomonas sp. CFBP 13719 TaxID=2775303 RepID=UPI0017801B5A|nr:hypothetical protein [Pseudomonas sp. CFBP 13719]MBD8615449.1 hypothetical protein [Pseudomonas putida]MBD8681898.1 hypothetical protein [Pseudomonas sp. CFBP 13719]
MTILNLKNIHPNQVVDHMLIACEQFVEDDATDCARHIKEHLRVAQSMSEEILAHYGSLEAASRALRGVCSQNQKLPENVLRTFLYACVQEHPLLEVFLNELHEMYADTAPGAEYLLIAGFLQSDRRFVVMPKPQMINSVGVLVHDPKAFRFVHGQVFDAEITAVFRKGSGALERLLSLYPDMSESSREMMDTTLCWRIYLSDLDDNSPIRATLRDKLDDVQDGLARIEVLFESEMSLDPQEQFLQRLDFTFDFIDGLPAEAAQRVLTKLDEIITCHIQDEPTFDNEDQLVECMTKVLIRAKRQGYNPLAVVSKTVNLAISEEDFVHGVLTNLPNLEQESSFLSMYMRWAQAAILSLDDDKLLSFDLDVRQLAWVAGRTGSQKIREHLKKTDTGRDVVFGQDLGL